MSDGTLNYDSVRKWMSLAIWAEGAFERWDAERELLGDPRDDAWYISVFHSIAEEALNRAFSLRSGHRAYAIRELLWAIAPNDMELQAAFLRIDKELWLTPPGAKPLRVERPNRKENH